MRRLRPKTAARFPRSRLGAPISQLRYATHKTFPKRTPDFNEPPGGCSDHKLLEYGAIVGFFGALFALDVAFTVAFECLTDMFKDKSFPPRVMERIIRNNTNASFPTEVQEITESHRNIFTLLLSSLDLPPQQKSCVHMVSVGPDLLPYLIILSVDAKAAVLLGKPYDEQKTNALMYVLQGYLDGATKDLKPGYIVAALSTFMIAGAKYGGRCITRVTDTCDLYIRFLTARLNIRKEWLWA